MSNGLWWGAALGFGLLGLALAYAIAARRTRALTIAIRSLAAGGDPPSPGTSEHAEVFRLVRELADARRSDLGIAAEREALLRAALEAAPTAIVMFTDVGRIALANAAARELFFENAIRRARTSSPCSAAHPMRCAARSRAMATSCSRWTTPMASDRRTTSRSAGS